MKNPLRKVRSFFIKPMLTKLEMLKGLIEKKDLKQIIIEQDLKIDELREMIGDFSTAFHSLPQILAQHSAKAPANVTEQVWGRYRLLQTLLTPKDIPKAKYIRVGSVTMMDGGYILLDQLPDKGIVYSFGIGLNVAFEKQMAERNFDVFMYDHTIECLPAEHEKFHFFKLGITGSQPPNDLMTLEQILVNNGHQDRNDIILKMDIEDADWDVLANCSQQELMHFPQIVLELHRLTTLELLEKINASLIQLNKTHQLVHVATNNGAPALYQFFSENILPFSLEVTYVRRTDHTFRLCNRFFPTHLDKPNILDRPDIISGYYGAEGKLTEAEGQLTKAKGMIAKLVKVINIYESSGENRKSLYNSVNCKSQLKQDLFVLSQLNFKKNGFFVEFGAGCGVNLSNSYLLEKDFYWQGILAEPARIWHDSLQKNRPSSNIELDCVWSSTGKIIEFNECEAGALSTIDTFSNSDLHAKTRKRGLKYSIKTISLIDLLLKYNAPKVIDYLSIDTEGSEFEILSAFDFDQFSFSVITVEHNFTPMREKIYDLLTSKGYQRKLDHLSRFDDWYTKVD